MAAATKQALEDLYLPYKPKRRTRAQIAREAGLEPLADALFADPTLDPDAEAAKYVIVRPAADGVEAINVPDVKAALDGARDILAERFAETAELLAAVRTRLWNHGVVTSTVVKGQELAEEEKFRDYYAYTEAIRTIPSHRALALFRGRALGVLKIELGLDEASEAVVPHPCVAMIAAQVGIENRGRRADPWLGGVCEWTWRMKVHSHLTVELLVQLREAAEAEAIKIFGRNLHELLLAAPAGPKAVLGLDPGIRTGCKVAVVDATGKLLTTTTVYPLQPRNDWQGARATLARLVVQHGRRADRDRQRHRQPGDRQARQRGDQVGRDRTAGAPGRQDRGQRSRRLGLFRLGLRRRRVSRAGRQPARRRLHCPSAAGPARRVGEDRSQGDRRRQYQHDVNQRALARSLDATVEDCVNAVGVDVNTASAPLLERVSGLNKVLAKNIVEYRDDNGPFRIAARSARCRSSATRRSSRPQGFCGSATATTRWIALRSTRKPIRWSSAYSRASTSRSSR